MIQIDHWHIELSSICTLKCPRCPRVEQPESLLNKQLKLDFFNKQFTTKIASQVKRVTLCGNDGDPIYANDMIDIVRWFKQANPNVQFLIITNGSYKKPEWWQELAGVLDHNDEIHWSIDGWDQTSNEQYRINCDWDSIVTGIDAFRQHNTSTYRTLASIVFKFNEHNLGDIQRLVFKHKFDAWQVTKSTKFDDNADELRPSDSNVSSNHRFQRQTTRYTIKQQPNMKQIFLERARNLKEYPALCYIGNKGVFLNSRGEFYPCCWVANRYEHNKDFIDRSQNSFNLYNRPLDQILLDNFWTTDFVKFDNLECKTKCTKELLHDIHHVTEW